MQNRDNCSFAKITAPRLNSFVPRERLFQLLDACRGRSNVWVSTTAGSGKTTLVASWLEARRLPSLWYQVDAGDGDLASFFYYLGQAAKKLAPLFRKSLPLFTPEYQFGISVFTRRYFEELFRRIDLSTVVVFDNYQEVPYPSDFHDVISQALETVPDGITIIILSRFGPPQQFARHIANNNLHLLGSNDINFTLDESRKLIDKQSRNDISDELLFSLHAKCEGWVAGLILLLARSLTTGMSDHDLDDLTDSGIFDYFANEIFDKTEPDTQYFLMTTAFLPNMEVKAAMNLTGMRTSGEILEKLHRQHYFTQKHTNRKTVYQYHALFREFLLKRATRSFSGDEISSIRKKAANLLQRSGQIEYAVDLLISEQVWTNLTTLIPNEAQNFIEQGRNKTLGGWILAIPEEVRNANGWLLYWLGISLAPFNPAEARCWFIKAFDLFEIGNDTASTLLTWAEIVDTFIVEWSGIAPLDKWIDWFYSRYNNLTFPTCEIEARCVSSMTGALIWRQPDHPDISFWAKRTLDTARKTGSSDLIVLGGINAMFYHLWMGDMANTQLIANEIRVSSRDPRNRPLTLIMSKSIEGVMAAYLEDANYESAFYTIGDAMEMADIHGIHVWDHVLLGYWVHAALFKNDLTAARQLLVKMNKTLVPQRIQAHCHYHHLLAWYHSALDDKFIARSHAEYAVKLAVEIKQDGFYFPEIFCRTGLSNILCETGDYAGAENQLMILHDLAIRSKSKIAIFMHGVTSARLAFLRNKDNDGLDILHSIFESGHKNNFFNMLVWWRQSDMADLCQRALEAGIEPDYTHKIIKMHNLITEDRIRMENWPWAIKIYTLGCFKILGNDTAEETFDRIQKKGLDLLKVVIANGTKDVSEECIIDALWPEADGDRARHSLKITVHRLRKQLNNDEILIVKNGSYTLDTRRVWVDVNNFNGCLYEIEKIIGSDSDNPNPCHEYCHDELIRLINRIIALYIGPFLQGESSAWVLSERKRLQNKFLRTISQSTTIIAQYDLNKVIPIYEQAIEAEPLAESLYQGLMYAYHKLGRKAEALVIYQQCARVLRREHNVTPSTETEALRNQVQINTTELQ